MAPGLGFRMCQPVFGSHADVVQDTSYESANSTGHTIKASTTGNQKPQHVI